MRLYRAAGTYVLGPGLGYICAISPVFAGRFLTRHPGRDRLSSISRLGLGLLGLGQGSQLHLQLLLHLMSQFEEMFANAQGH